ncbi:VOC family protein [Paenibacillus chitinolyticus]|uniref:VOC family protein n=1 Tax=Paenibacillus chitinolyticus TaxID=79263 RepID=A0A410X3D2_9BACL|nr:VOC family protein [Paenibacillus chitinolyticus]MCY9593013.1 VOC family protein [Paenibacillus chitinolyticus]MCY9598917.1 VOC family protein [Paenibacillus chitinolyticus]QAV21130.1 VOC family protein [Paenibacillus chitinolyticus]
MDKATPFLWIKNTAEGIEFYKKAFDAVEKYRLTEPGGKVAHAEITIGGAKISIAGEYPEYGILGPETIGNTTVGIQLQVDDADKLFQQAIAAGATMVNPMEDQFYGDRAGSVKDPFGHYWMISTTIKTVDPEEMQKRFLALYGS